MDGCVMIVGDTLLPYKNMEENKWEAGIQHINQNSLIIALALKVDTIESQLATANAKVLETQAKLAFFQNRGGAGLNGWANIQGKQHYTVMLFLLCC